MNAAGNLHDGSDLTHDDRVVGRSKESLVDVNLILVANAICAGIQG